MDKYVVTSLRQGAGKTSIIIGLARVLNRRIGYIKPLGERILYRKKRLWDYDAALFTAVFHLDENPEEMSIGFLHSKLSYMLDEEGTREKLFDLQNGIGKEREIFFIEAGKDITYGASVHLDALTLARQLDAQLLVVASGDEDALIDDLVFFHRQVRTEAVRCKGIIVNKVANIADFRASRLPLLKRHGIDLLGIVPYCVELSSLAIGYLADRLFAKVIAGEGNLTLTVKGFFIASMSVEAAVQNPLFQQPRTVIITSGDRSDMIRAVLSSGKAAALILTNNILPEPDLISKAASLEIPLLVVSADTLEIIKQIEDMEALLTAHETDKLATMEQLVRNHVDFQMFS